MTGVRDAASRTRHWMRLGTAPGRPLPNFLVIGAQKAGTTSLYAYLTQFPDVRSAASKELHFFDHNFDRGERWYRSQFPARLPNRNWITGEATPYYLLHPSVPRRVARILPDVRLIALLRHPVARAYSHFQHSRARGHEPLEDFQQALLMEAERTDDAWQALERGGARQPAVEAFSYLRRGRYAPQLKRWLDVVPAESLLVLTAEELFETPLQIVDRTRRHLGLLPSDMSVDIQRRNARTYDSLPPPVRRQLGDVYAEDVAEVERILGRSTGWTL